MRVKPDYLSSSQHTLERGNNMKKLFISLMVLFLSIVLVSCTGVSSETTTLSSSATTTISSSATTSETEGTEPLSQDDILDSLSSAIKDLFE